MTKTIQTILYIVGLVLIGYGIYRMIIPETSLDIGILKVEVQDNDSAYVAIGLGLAALVLGFLGGKKGN